MDDTTQSPPQPPSPPAETIPEAQVILPPDPSSPAPGDDRAATGQPDALTPESAPRADPFADLDYQGMVDTQGLDMSASELQAVYAPAHAAVETFAAGPLLDAMEYEGIVTPSQGIRVLGQLGQDLQMWRQAQADYLKTLPPGTSVKVSPLTGEALAKQRAQVIRTYLDAGAAYRLESSGLLNDPAVRRVVDRIVLEIHHYREALPRLEQAQAQRAAQVEARQEVQALQAQRSAVAQMSEPDFESHYGKVFAEWKAADDVNDGNEKARLGRELQRLAEARWRR